MLLGVARAAPAGAILRCHGQVEVIRVSGASLPALPGLLLMAGDRVLVGRHSDCRILLSGGRALEVPGQSSLTLKEPEPDPGFTTRLGQALEKNLLLPTSQTRSVLAGARGADEARDFLPLSPVNTRLLEAEPFQWRAGQNMESYLFELDGVSQLQTSGLEAPQLPLETGRVYFWSVAPADDPEMGRVGAWVEIVPPAERLQVESELAEASDPYSRALVLEAHGLHEQAADLLAQIPGRAALAMRGWILLQQGLVGPAYSALHQAETSGAPPDAALENLLGVVCQELLENRLYWRDREQLLPGPVSDLNRDPQRLVLAHFERACQLEPDNLDYRANRQLEVLYLKDQEGPSPPLSARELIALLERLRPERARYAYLEATVYLLMQRDQAEEQPLRHFTDLEPTARGTDLEGRAIELLSAGQKLDPRGDQLEGLQSLLYLGVSPRVHQALETLFPELYSSGE